MVPVISGLKVGEKIVVRGGLLLDGAASQLL
jgi:cobalt-zinc-cadmium efflux system membrane fusion protein